MRKKIIKIIISGSLIAILFFWIDLNQVKLSFADANFFYIFLAFLLIMFNRILMPVKWNLLLRVKNIRISWFEATKIYFISSFLGMYLPPTVGGDMVRAYYVHKKKFSITDIISSIVIERILGFIALLLFCLIGSLIFINYFSDLTFDLSKFIIISIALISIAVTGFFLSLNKAFSRKFSSLLQRFTDKKIIGKIVNKLDNFYTSYLSYRTQKKSLLVFFLLTCIEVSLPIFRSYLVALAFNSDVNLLYFFAFVPVILLLIRLPISLDGFGIHEGGFVYFLALTGVDTAIGFSIGLMNHLLFIAGVLPGGIFYASNRDKEFGRVKINSPIISKERNQ